MAITVLTRETAIINFLKKKGPAPIKAIYEFVSGDLSDTVSIQAYYKIIFRMVNNGRLVETDGEKDRGKEYSVASHLNIDNPQTLDDIYEMMSLLSPADAIATSIDALDYFGEQQEITLKKAAEALKDENPVDIFFGMIEHKVRLFEQDLELFREKDLREPTLENRLARQYEDLDLLLYRGMNLSLEAVNILSARDIRSSNLKIFFDPNKVKEELKYKVFGERFIFEVDVSGTRGDPRRKRMSVAGSDGSIHAGVLGLSTAKDFADDYDQDYITFNNSVAYVEQPKETKNKIEFPFHCVPMTRSALEDPSNRGMVLTKLMFPDLSDSKYEHMAKCAVDVVQLRVDSAIFSGTARAMGTGELLPQPVVHIRDGTVTPQEREFKHYKMADSYGDMVREGIREYRKILERIKATDKPPVFAGAVKSTQLKIFSRALNWYIVFGSKNKFGKALAPGWDLTRAAYITDNAAMTFLLASLENKNKEGKFWTTCGLCRGFHSLTEFYVVKKTAEADLEFPRTGWEKFFEQVKQRDTEFNQTYGAEQSYLESVDIENDAFVYMCNNADYVTFYIGHTAGEPPPLVPRYEFIENLRSKTVDQAIQRVTRNVTLIIEALDETQFAIDADHNYLTQKKLIKLIPYVTYHAHEKSKSLGKQLQAELKAIVIERLRELKRFRFPKGVATKILPVSVQKYVERYFNSIKDEMKKDPGKFAR